MYCTPKYNSANSIHIVCILLGNTSFRFLHSVNEIEILIKQLYFNVQRGRQNELDLVRKLENKILITYEIQNRYFQEERFNK